MSLGVALLALAACGSSYRAVTATAQVGENLEQYRPQVSVLGESCQLEQVFEPAAKCPARTEKYEKALEALVAYARELEAAAGDTPLHTGDAVETALGRVDAAHWTALPADTEPVIATFTHEVSVFLTRSATRASVQKTITAIGPSLDSVTDILTTHFTNERANLQQLRCRLSCEIGSPKDSAECPELAPAVVAFECKAPDVTKAVLLFELEARMQKQDIALGRAATTMRAFRKAHAKLVQNVDHLGSATLYDSILDEVRAVMASAGTASTVTH